MTVKQLPCCQGQRYQRISGSGRVSSLLRAAVFPSRSSPQRGAAGQPSSPAQGQPGSLAHAQRRRRSQEGSKGRNTARPPRPIGGYWKHRVTHIRGGSIKSQCLRLLPASLLQDLSSTPTCWTWIRESSLNVQYMNKWFLESQRIHVINHNTRLSSKHPHHHSAVVLICSARTTCGKVEIFRNHNGQFLKKFTFSKQAVPAK